jgi:Fe-S oxidoreductase
VETFKAKNVQKVITNCPHCFNTFKNEYPQFDGHFEVMHHTQFLESELARGGLVAKHPVDATVTYHDSCYLGAAERGLRGAAADAGIRPGVT